MRLTFFGCLIIAALTWLAWGSIRLDENAENCRAGTLSLADEFRPGDQISSVLARLDVIHADISIYANEESLDRKDVDTVNDEVEILATFIVPSVGWAVISKKEMVSFKFDHGRRLLDSTCKLVFTGP